LGSSKKEGQRKIIQKERNRHQEIYSILLNEEPSDYLHMTPYRVITREKHNLHLIRVLRGRTPRFGLRGTK
jgi:hypothetical protein